MIFGTSNPEKIYGFVHLTCQMKPLLPQEIQKKSFSTVLFIYTSDYLSYLRRKQTVIHLPTPSENVTTLTCELLKFFIRLKVCCVRVTIFCVNRCFQSFSRLFSLMVHHVVQIQPMLQQATATSRNMSIPVHVLLL